MRIAKALAALGPRFTGTNIDEHAVNLLLNEMRSVGLQAERHSYTFSGWELLAPPYLQILTPGSFEIPCAAMVRSGSGRIHGHLRAAGLRSVIGVFQWESFEVVDTTGEVMGLVIQRSDGPAIPQCLDEDIEIPAVIVGADWLNTFGGTLPENVEVELSVQCQCKPNCTGFNVIGVRDDFLKADSEIMVCAHFDSMYGSPGANDNASGVDVVLQLAARQLSLQSGVAVRFVIFSGEEWIQLGANAYLRSRSSAGDLAQIKLLLNIDMVGKGAYLWPSVTDHTEPLFRQAVKDVLPHTQVVYHNPPMKGDHYPFHEAGIPSIMLLWWPDTVYHTSYDVADALDEDTLHYSTELATRIIEIAAMKLADPSTLS
jgi:hypothetical protein